MSLRMQALLLRFLETGEIQSVGAHQASTVANVRVIAATNRNLAERVAAGEFREDLLYRLRVIHLHVPPLRERREDVPLLIDYLLKRSGRGITMSEEAMQVLQRYRWPGNVRELQNVVEQAIWLADGGVIELDHLPRAVRTAGDALLPARERRRQVADELYDALVSGGYSFWEHIHPIFLARDITRHDVRELVVSRLAHDARQLSRAAAAVRDVAHGLQAVPQLPDDARLQGRLPGVPSGEPRTLALRARSAAAACGTGRRRSPTMSPIRGRRRFRRADDRSAQVRRCAGAQVQEKSPDRGESGPFLSSVGLCLRRRYEATEDCRSWFSKRSRRLPPVYISNDLRLSGYNDLWSAEKSLPIGNVSADFLA